MNGKSINTTAEAPIHSGFIEAGQIPTHYLAGGEGDCVVLLHGSGPGVSAEANWRLILPALARKQRVVAPDLLGFGQTRVSDDTCFNLDVWVRHLEAFLDAMQIDQATLVGNSFGGALALALATRSSARVSRVVLMGAVGVHFSITDALEQVWGYTPSLDNMRRLLKLFAYDTGRITDDLVRLRHEASLVPGIQETYARMFPIPRQQCLDALVTDEDEIAKIEQPVLIVHGRDDKVIPVSVANKLFEIIPDARLHVFARCGHWTQIERADEFAALVQGFLDCTDNTRS